MSDKPEDQPLQIEVANGLLNISIGVDCLIFALEHAQGMADVKITDKDKFMSDFVRELKCELGEDGSTVLHVAFDRAGLSAVENGSEGVTFGEDERAYERDES